MSDTLDLTACPGLPVADGAGRPAGRIADLEVEATERFPRVVAACVRCGREVAAVPWDGVERLDEGGLVLVDLAGKRLARR